MVPVAAVGDVALFSPASRRTDTLIGMSGVVCVTGVTIRFVTT